MRIRTNSYVSRKGLMQPFPWAGHQPQSSEWVISALGVLRPSFPAPMEMRENFLISIGEAAEVNMNKAIQQKVHRGQEPKNMLEGPDEWPGLQCNAQLWVSNGDVLVISSDLSSIIFAGNVRTALTINVWNHFQLFAFQVSLLRSGDISRLTGVPLEGRFNVWLKAFVAGAVGGFLFKLLWLVTCISYLSAVGFCYSSLILFWRRLVINSPLPEAPPGMGRAGWELN